MSFQQLISIMKIRLNLILGILIGISCIWLLLFLNEITKFRNLAIILYGSGIGESMNFYSIGFIALFSFFNVSYFLDQITNLLITPEVIAIVGSEISFSSFILALISDFMLYGILFLIILGLWIFWIIMKIRHRSEK